MTHIHLTCPVCFCQIAWDKDQTYYEAHVRWHRTLTNQPPKETP